MLLPIIQHVRPIFHSNKFFLRRKKEHLIIVAFHRLARETLMMGLLFVSGYPSMLFLFFLA
ncbi:hypothetical protein C4A76_13290 [Brevibacillus laterosporus]|uniref:Uncharacterized protein n=1 Tax=Brevibacillus laterosporus TaxID=1465 RepID=A0AAP8QD09_BRELA|nr:hypothetical protein C4A76_13290 [Brevibacillus laterosporus]PPA98037.1 hypothetical protein C4A77_14525 [Brevibacillus laterosporus]